MSPRERELLQGMGNCFEACHADFQETLRMVGGNRQLTPERVESILHELRAKYSSDPEYRTLRARLPADFPC